MIKRADFTLRTTNDLLRTGLLCSLIFLYACNGKKPTPERIDPVKELKTEIKEQLARIEEGESLDDSTRLLAPGETKKFYGANRYEGVWAIGDSLTPLSDSIFYLIRNARKHGLFPETYHLKSLERFHSRWMGDTLHTSIRNNFKELARREILLTDAFLTICRHVQYGHISIDSLKDSNTYDPETYTTALRKVIGQISPDTVLASLEPTNPGYRNLKAALPEFLARANFSRTYTYVEYPFRDSMSFIQTLIQRLKEERYLDTSIVNLDTAQLASALKKVQSARGLKIDGKYGPQLIGSLNNNDSEIFFKAAINLDRYRVQPDTLSDRYLLVNLPAFELQVIDQDTLVLESRVIVGKPKTPTPLLNSQMNQLIVFPTWTIPASIIADEILPAIKRDPGYLARKGYNLYDHSGNEVDPYSVNWSKYKKGIPYKIVQGEGLGNALGIMKFNFPNEHSVYLHDTNQRSLFRNENRSLSHGCVRVQNWEGLYQYLLLLDSIKAAENTGPFTSVDSIHRWLKGEKKKRVIPLKNQLPIYFRYYTAAGKEGKLEVYNDVYGYDGIYRERIMRSIR